MGFGDWNYFTKAVPLTKLPRGSLGTDIGDEGLPSGALMKDMVLEENLSINGDATG